MVGRAESAAIDVRERPGRAPFRTGLRDRLAARRAEIEAATLTRVYAVSDPTQAGDPTYLEGLRSSVSAAIDYGLAAIESSDRTPPPIPPTLLVQARLAARSGISLDTVLRRYFAGYALLGDFLIEEVEERDLQGVALKRLLRTQAAIFDRLLAAIGEEHAREREGRLDTAEERRTELVRRLLAGERLDASELAYDFDGFHVAWVARGPGLGEMARELAAALDRRLLAIHPDECTFWGWLGGRRAIDRVRLKDCIAAALPPRVTLAIGEPGEGLDGWRLSHRQGRAAMPIARGRGDAVFYADVALLASILQDDLLTTSLHQIYLEPLERDRDGGEAARETLRAYFASGRNISSAAAALSVNRNTIASRLRTIEATVERPLAACAAELEAALNLGEYQQG